MKQTNERLCALAQKGDAAALEAASLTPPTVVVPVSYTHLDVYKRQRLSSAAASPFCASAQSRSCVCFMGVFLLCGRLQDSQQTASQPVSYTHLDVYKRQNMYTSVCRIMQCS